MSNQQYRRNKKQMKLGPKISVAVTHQITSPESDFSVLTRDVMVHHGKPKR